MDVTHVRRKQDNLKYGLQEPVYIILQEYDFSFLQHEIDKFVESWKSGVSIQDIAARIMRPVQEVFLLALDLIERNKINQRNGGVWGENLNCM